MSDQHHPPQDDLDFDREVASARAASDQPVFTQEEAGLRNRLGWGRSPIIAVAVIIVGCFLLVATWSDFRYFLRVIQDEPRDIGRVEDIYRNGEFSENFDNEWVILHGEPDVQHAARTPSRDGWYGVLRLLRAEGKLFVAVPRTEETAPTVFPGDFEGRMRRVGSAPQWEKLQQFFDAEQVVDLVDLEVASVLDGAPRTLDGGAIEPAAGDTVRLVVEFPVGIVQLGRSTWKTREAAEQAVGDLGLAWGRLDKSSSISWQFVVEAPSGTDFLDLAKQLERNLDPETKATIDKNRADPKQGAIVLPRRVTYSAPVGQVGLSGGLANFPYGPDSPQDTGWKRVGNQLEPIEPDRGTLSVQRDQIVAIRLERPLKADPDGYLVMVGVAPMTAWPSAVMFVGVFGVMMLNVWALVAVMRRRRADAAPA